MTMTRVCLILIASTALASADPARSIHRRQLPVRLLLDGILLRACRRTGRAAKPPGGSCPNGWIPVGLRVPAPRAVMRWPPRIHLAGGIRKMPKIGAFDNLTRGHQFDGGPFALDLYRLLGMVLSDKRIASLGDETSYLHAANMAATGTLRKAELLPHPSFVCCSAAHSVRPKARPARAAFQNVSRKTVRLPWPNLPKRQREVLTIREACNKIIHATDVIEDEVNSDWRQNPDQLGVYIRPFVYLHGTKDGADWRAKVVHHRICIGRREYLR